MMEKVYSFKYVDEQDLFEAANAVVEAALLCSEAKKEERLIQTNKDALVDAVFNDPSLAAYLFQAGSPFEGGE